MICTGFIFGVLGRWFPLGPAIGGFGEPFDLVHLAKHWGVPALARRCYARGRTGRCYDVTRRRFKDIGGDAHPDVFFQCEYCPHVLSSEHGYMNHLHGAHERALVVLPILLDGAYARKPAEAFFNCPCAYCVRARTHPIGARVTLADMKVISGDVPL